MAPDVLLYTRRGCHLCDEAREILLRHGLFPKEVDIDQEPLFDEETGLAEETGLDPETGLAERYGECVPVVFIDGRERFRGRIDERLLKRLLRARRP